MFGLIAMGLVLVFRRGLAASPFLVFSILYAIAQVPAYSATFVTGAPIPRWFQALAVGKLLLVVSFYPAFFSPAKHHNPLGLSISLAAKFQLNQIAARLMSAAIYGMGTVVAEVIRIWVLRWLASFGWLPAR